jgi:DNA-binding SARP family transcriptional activator/Flp pilus assembly protein TadD
MEFLLLGPLAVYADRAPVPVRHGKQRAVLAALLLNANQVVSVDDLAEILWGAQPPPSAAVTLRNYVKRLRQSLGDAGRDRITTCARGYVISVDAAELDVTQFEVLSVAARAAAAEGWWDRAATQAGEALSLWRGEPLADVQSQVLALREIPRITDMRLRALETRIEADMHVGHVDVIPELRRLVQTEPFREHVHALLMLALCRDGRRAEALAAYRQARRMLVNELGIEPGAELRELHQRILAGDVMADSGRRGPPYEGVPAVPRQLPAPVAHFIGRGDELAVLDGLADPVRVRGPGGAVIAAICGTAGVGKTALAVHWAHRVAERFPDGQLYINLRGYDPEQPVTAADALAGFLGALDVPRQEIPAGAVERLALYRSLLASRRMLIVLDNARETEQLRPLLPGTPACVTVVTSRDSLAGLVARDGARRLELDVLPVADALILLRTLIDGRVADDPGAAAALATCCCRLPLALRIAAELAAARPAAALGDLVTELADERGRLDLLDAGGDPRTAIRAVFSWSCRHLDAAAARAFRLTGLHPAPGLDVYAVAALTGATLGQATRVLDQLARAHLIQATGPGRYGLHELLRAYAAEQAAAQDGEKDRRAALTRLFDFYLRAAHVAMDIVFPAERHHRPSSPGATAEVPPLPDAVAAGAWLDAERENLIATAAYAAACGWPGHAIGLAATLASYLDAGRYHEALTIHGHARQAAARSGDRAGEAVALTNLGLAAGAQGRYQQARGFLRQALALFRQTGDQAGQASALNGLGSVDRQRGRYQQARDHLRQALALYRAAGDRHGEARVLSSLGVIDRRQGRYQQATEHQEHALALFRQTGDRVREAETLFRLGVVALRQGHSRQAAGHLHQALALFRDTGDNSGQAEALKVLGDVDLAQGRYQRATEHHQWALALFRQTGDRAGETDALNGLGGVSLALGQPRQARIIYAAALSLAIQIEEKHDEANAHHGLGKAYAAIGDSRKASHHWQQALTLYTSLGAPEADQVRTRLNVADHDS